MNPEVAELLEGLIDGDAPVLTPEEMAFECRRLAVAIRQAWVGR